MNQLLSAIRLMLYALGLGAVGWCALNLGGLGQATGLGIGVALTLACKYLTVPVASRSNPYLSWSIRSSVHIGLLLVAGVEVAVLSAAAGSLVIDMLDRRPARVMLDNLVSDALGIALAGAIFAATGGVSGSLDLPADYLPALLAVLVYAVTLAATFAVTSVVDTPRPLAVLRSELQRMPLHLYLTLLECLLGLALGFVWMLEPWAAPIILPLTYSMFMAVSRGAKLQRMTDRALEAFANIVDERDRYTAEHSARVCEYTMMIAEHMHLPEKRLQRLYWTSRLHDLGKVAIDNAILNKPGKLTDEEFDVMKTHPVVSARILNSFSFDEYDTDVVLCHHERYDGRGYLRRQCSGVPMESFIMAVADTFDAMTSDRPYRSALPAQAALEEIHRNIGTQFHPDPARAFLELMRFELPAPHSARDEDEHEAAA